MDKLWITQKGRRTAQNKKCKWANVAWHITWCCLLRTHTHKLNHAKSRWVSSPHVSLCAFHSLMLSTHTLVLPQSPFQGAAVFTAHSDTQQRLFCLCVCVFLPLAESFLVLMILAAYSCPEEIFTHRLTTENAPLKWTDTQRQPRHRSASSLRCEL